MAIDRSYVAKNNAERARLRALVARCTDDMLARPASGGWTVAGVLAHLAFWDQRIVTLVEAWRRAGIAAVPATLDGSGIDWINDAAKRMFLALPPRRSAEIALEIADRVDALVAALPDDLVTRNAAAGNPVNLLRAEHRHDHLGELERVIAR